MQGSSEQKLPHDVREWRREVKAYQTNADPQHSDSDLEQKADAWREWSSVYANEKSVVSLDFRCCW